MLIHTCCSEVFGQVYVQSQTDATIGLDRKAWNSLSSLSQGYAYDFPFPNATSTYKAMTSIVVRKD